jgi:hypothetical protein
MFHTTKELTKFLVHCWTLNLANGACRLLMSRQILYNERTSVKNVRNSRQILYNERTSVKNVRNSSIDSIKMTLTDLSWGHCNNLSILVAAYSVWQWTSSYDFTSMKI